jgi:hypothetical protein
LSVLWQRSRSLIQNQSRQIPALIEQKSFDRIARRQRGSVMPSVNPLFTTSGHSRCGLRVMPNVKKPSPISQPRRRLFPVASISVPCHRVSCRVRDRFSGWAVQLHYLWKFGDVAHWRFVLSRMRGWLLHRTLSKCAMVSRRRAARPVWRVRTKQATTSRPTRRRLTALRWPTIKI